MNEGENTSLISGDIDIEMAWNIGKAIAEWITLPGHIVVVYAPLRQSEANAVMEGLLLQGRDVADRGPGDLSAAKRYLVGPCAGAVIVGQVGDTITVEACLADGSVLTGDVLRRLWEQAQAGNFVPASIKGRRIA